MSYLLAYVMEKADESFSCWIIRNCGVDPDTRMKCSIRGPAPLDYYLTAYELSIYLRLPTLERYLGGIGCDLRNSKALCFVIDTLLNKKPIYDKNSVVRFGIDLLVRGINVDRILDVNLFADAPRRSYRGDDFHFEIFPRNCNLRCREVIRKMAPTNPLFASLNETIVAMAG